MLRLNQHPKSLRDTLHPKGVKAETQLAVDTLARPLVMLSEWPDIAIQWMSGIHVITHQRWMLYQAHRGALKNVNVSSRGTSKSATVCVLYAAYHAMCYRGRKIVELSASGFRGGQLIFSDVALWLEGGWDSQDGTLEFFRQSVTRDTGRGLVTRGNTHWTIKWDSFSKMETFPTNDHEKLRGIRGHLLFIDEANTFDPMALAAVAKSFLAVETDFEHGGENSLRNAIFYTSTIDYQWRDFQAEIQAARLSLQQDYAAMQAAERGDLDTLRDLQKKRLHEYTYTSFDYTDTLIRRYLTDGDTVYEVRWPNPKLRFKWDYNGIPFSIRRPDGTMQREGEPLELLRTYPFAKDLLESDLEVTEESIWLSEQRNVTDTATGDVYPHWLLEKVSGASEPLIPYAACSEDYQRVYALEERDYDPPVLWRCTDPCVLGVDVATGDRDFAAFVVIRVGPLAKGPYDPLTHHGHTDWSNVIWVEQHRLMSVKDIADKVREYRARYNLVWHFDPSEQDDWKLCRAVGMDKFGGGSAVRDALVFMDAETPPPGQRRIYDPLDDDPRIQAYHGTKEADPLLDLITPSDILNERCVDYTLAQMKVGRLYLAKYLQGSQRIADKAIGPGYAGAKVLKHQLAKIQQEPTQRARRFFMPGDKEKVEGKKDVFSAFLYAAKQLRAHLIRQQMLDTTPPPMGVRITQIGKRRGTHGRSLGARM